MQKQVQVSEYEPFRDQKQHFDIIKIGRAQALTILSKITLIGLDPPRVLIILLARRVVEKRFRGTVD